MDLESPEDNIKFNIQEANKLITKILYKVDALGYGLPGTLLIEDALPGVNKTELDQTPLKDLLKKLGCVMRNLDRLQNNIFNSEETNRIRKEIEKIKDYRIVSKENKKILNTWLKWRRGAPLRSRRGDCKYQLKY